jgi:hypothetical protein
MVFIRCTWLRIWSGGEHFVSRVTEVEILPKVGLLGELSDCQHIKKDFQLHYNVQLGTLTAVTDKMYWSMKCDEWQHEGCLNCGLYKWYLNYGPVHSA